MSRRNNPPWARLLASGCRWFTLGAWLLLGASMAHAATVTLTTTWSTGQVLTATALNTNFTDITTQVNGNLDQANLAATITFADGDYLDFASCNASANGECLRLPQAASTASQTTEGLLSWDTDDDALCIGDSAANRCLDFTGDLTLNQASPQLIWRDSTDNVAYTWHLDTAETFNRFSLWRGTSTGIGNFSVSPSINAGNPILHVDSNDDVRLVNATSLIVDELTNGGVLFGGGANGAITASAVMAEGQVLVGDGTTAPAVATLGGDATISSAGTVAIAANAVALTTDTTGNYVASVADGSGIDVTGTAGEGWTATANLLYTDTLAADPSMNAEECRFSTDGTGGGLICEGSTADTIEGLLVFPPTTSDRTLTLPDATDTLVGKATTDILTNKTLAAADNVIAADTAVALAANGANCSAGNYPLGVDTAGAVESCTAAGATGFFVGAFTRDTTVASGTQAITGVGFTVKACRFHSTQSASREGGWGFDDGTRSNGIFDDAATAGTYQVETAQSITDEETNGVDYYQGEITTLGSDGFTITWTRTGTPSGTLTVQYLASQ